MQIVPDGEESLTLSVFDLCLEVLAFPKAHIHISDISQILFKVIDKVRFELFYAYMYYNDIAHDIRICFICILQQ